MSAIVAKRLVEHLERSGLVVMKKPPIGLEHAALSGVGCASAVLFVFVPKKERFGLTLGGASPASVAVAKNAAPREKSNSTPTALADADIEFNYRSKRKSW